jgi:hypothetical protein
MTFTGEAVQYDKLRYNAMHVWSPYGFTLWFLPVCNVYYNVKIVKRQAIIVAVEKQQVLHDLSVYL